MCAVFRAAMWLVLLEAATLSHLCVQSLERSLPVHYSSPPGSRRAQVSGGKKVEKFSCLPTHSLCHDARASKLTAGFSAVLVAFRRVAELFLGSPLTAVVVADRALPRP